jgi:hypothetical protein
MTNHNQGRGRTAEAAATKEETQREERKTERVSMAQNEILAYKQEPGYHLRWFNAKQEGRIEQAKRAWYEPVTNAEGGEVRAHKNGSEMLLMRIPDTYYREDFERGQEKIREQTGEKVETLQTTGAVPDYIPDGQKRVAQRDYDI